MCERSPKSTRKRESRTRRSGKEEISEVEELFQDYTIARGRGDVGRHPEFGSARASVHGIFERVHICSSLRIRGEEETRWRFTLVRNHFEDFLNHKVERDRAEASGLHGSCGTGCRRRGRQARSKTRTTVRSGRGCLHSPRSHRREDRRGVSRFPERYESASASTLASHTARSRGTKANSKEKTRTSSPRSSIRPAG